MSAATDEEPEGLSRFARRPYRVLLGRGADDAAARLASLSPSEQKQYVKNEFVDFDPKFDDPANSGPLRIKNAYDGLLDLGQDDLAGQLRGVTNSGAAAGEGTCRRGSRRHRPHLRGG